MSITPSAASVSAVKKVSVAIVGVGLVGSEFISQLLSFPKPNHFRIVGISSSKINAFDPFGFDFSSHSDWQSYLTSSSSRLSIRELVRELSNLVHPGSDVILVDNTSSDDVAGLYPTFLKAGINVITPNKKAFSSDWDLYERILTASLESGSRFLNESTVGAGLPIISTLKDLVATGDKVRYNILAIQCICADSQERLPKLKVYFRGR